MAEADGPRVGERTAGAPAAPSAEAAVGRLGAASAAHRSEAAAAPPEAGAPARILAEDPEFLGAVPAYARIHAQAQATLAAALDGIWPRSSPQRPHTPEDAADRCAGIVAAFGRPEAAAARRIGELPAGDPSDRLKIEGRQALLLRERLASAGIDHADPGGTETGRAATALDALYRGHRLLSRAALDEALAAARARRDGLAPLEGAIGRLVDLAGIPDASPAQVVLLARWLATAPTPWPAVPGDFEQPGPGRASRAETVADAIGVEVESRARASAEARALDEAHGTAWRVEEPGKLEAAARILGDGSDVRAPKAAAYAAALGAATEPLSGPDRERAASALSAMAMARLSMRRTWPPGCMADAAALVPPALAEDPEGAEAYLRAAVAWREPAGRTETLRRLAASIDALAPQDRDALAASAPDILRELQAVPPERRGGPAAALASAFAAEASALESHAEALSPFPEATVEAARRPAGHIRELRACLARIAAEPSFPGLGLDGPQAVADALAWSDSARLVLPDGVSPTGRHAALVNERAREAVEAAREIARMEGEAAVRVGCSDPDLLVAAGRLALAQMKLAQARTEVAATDGWGLVAWLEAEGIEPELWGEALASREVASTPPDRPEVDSGGGAPAQAEIAAEPDEAVPATVRWRRLRVATPAAGAAQAALGTLILA